jgi:hypothetical protein
MLPLFVELLTGLKFFFVELFTGLEMFFVELLLASK